MLVRLTPALQTLLRSAGQEEEGPEGSVFIASGPSGDGLGNGVKMIYGNKATWIYRLRFTSALEV